MSTRVSPESLAQLADAVRAGLEAAHPFAIEAGGTKQDWLRPGPAPHTVLDLSRMRGVVEHEPGDMTVTVRAGTRLAELQEHLRASGQRLAVDPALGPDEAATVGGILSTDDAGPGRLAFGSLRELCIGATFVLSDGTVARSGGKVIKNVAGFDLCKLFCGARGTLGVVAEMTVRLHPIFAKEATLRVRAPVAEAIRGAAKIDTNRFAPTALTVQDEALWIRFEGGGPAVSAQVARARRTLAQVGLHIDGALDGEDSRAAWRQMNEARRARPGETTLAISTLPSEVEALAEAADEAAPRARLVVDPALGALLVHLPAAPLSQVAATAQRLRARARAARAHLRVRSRPEGLDALLDPYGPLPDSLEVMRAVKSALDPAGRCQPNRYLFEDRP